MSEESPYSRGYWLRTPVYQEGENGGFIYGTEAYAVDLRDGTIGPAEVSDGRLRPPSGVLSAAVIAGAPGSGRHWEQRLWISIVTGGKYMQFQKHEMKMRRAGKAGRAAVFCLCAGLVLGDPVKGFAWGADGIRPQGHRLQCPGPSASDGGVQRSVGKLGRRPGIPWMGPEGTEAGKSRSRSPQRHSSWAFPGLRPWEWRSKRGGTYPGDYSGSCFELTRDIDLGGMEWIPHRLLPEQLPDPFGSYPGLPGAF